jgi:hypothetical protein
MKRTHEFAPLYTGDLADTFEKLERNRADITEFIQKPPIYRYDTFFSSINDPNVKDTIESNGGFFNQLRTVLSDVKYAEILQAEKTKDDNNSGKTKDEIRAQKIGVIPGNIDKTYYSHLKLGLESDINFKNNGLQRAEKFAQQIFIRTTQYNKKDYGNNLFCKTSKVDFMIGVFAFLHEVAMQKYTYDCLAKNDGMKTKIYISPVHSWGVIYDNNDNSFNMYMIMDKIHIIDETYRGNMNDISFAECLTAETSSPRSVLQFPSSPTSSFKTQVPSKSELYFTTKYYFKKIKETYMPNKEYVMDVIEVMQRTLLDILIEFFKKYGMKHNDATTTNILIGANCNRIAIIDFGRAEITGENVNLRSDVGLPIFEKTVSSGIVKNNYAIMYDFFDKNTDFNTEFNAMDKLGGSRRRTTVRRRKGKSIKRKPTRKRRHSSIK